MEMDGVNLLTAVLCAICRAEKLKSYEEEKAAAEDAVVEI